MRALVARCWWNPCLNQLSPGQNAIEHPDLALMARGSADVRVPFRTGSDGQRSASGTRSTSTSSPAPRPVLFRVSALKDTRNRPPITPIVVL
jgi:hypothetical protein